MHKYVHNSAIYVHELKFSFETVTFFVLYANLCTFEMVLPWK